MSTTPKIKIFLSSTYTDLSAIRTKVSEWLAGVFGADLIIMETFGSEAATQVMLAPPLPHPGPLMERVWWRDLVGLGR